MSKGAIKKIITSKKSGTRKTSKEDMKKDNNKKDIDTLRAEFYILRSEMIKDKNMSKEPEAFYKRELQRAKIKNSLDSEADRPYNEKVKLQNKIHSTPKYAINKLLNPEKSGDHVM